VQANGSRAGPSATTSTATSLTSVMLAWSRTSASDTCSCGTGLAFITIERTRQFDGKRRRDLDGELHLGNR
jgi:hypothetical protein